MAYKSSGNLKGHRRRKSRSGPTSSGNQEVRLQEAMELHRAGRLAEAETIYRQILEESPENASAWHLLGVIACQVGQHATALELTDRALRLRPDVAEVWGNRGFALCGLGRHEEALESFNKAVCIRQDFAEHYGGRGNALFGMGRFAEALADYEVAVRLNPGYAEAQQSRGTALHMLGRYEEAVEAYGAAAAVRPNYPEAHCNRAMSLQALGRYNEAASACAEAIRLAPEFAEAYLHLGNAQHSGGDSEAAVTSYERAALLRPELEDACFNRGIALEALSRKAEALASYERSIALKPAHAEAHNNRGCMLHASMRYDEALASFDTAIALKPDLAEAYFNRGNTALVLGRFESALEGFDKAILYRPDYEWAMGSRILAKSNLCDWSAIEGDCRRLESAVLGGEKAATPFEILARSGSALVQKLAAEIYVRTKFPPRAEGVNFSRGPRKTRLRIGYFSADFHNHATSYLMAEVFERHNRERFEIVGFSFGPNPADEMNRRVSQGMDRFLDVRNRTDPEVARLSRELGVDIAVDLKGFTKEARPGIFAERAAPVQVNYLGYPGTMGAKYIDYLIADEIVIPEDSRRYYSEKVVYLPDCYQPNDSRRAISAKPCLRIEAGLPEQGFVFCSFNSVYKIMPAVFDSWMRILGRVPGSVLWLMGENEGAIANLRKEAERRGVPAERLVFAQPLPLADHLARVSLADLFLDTFPYGAHTTASDALWAGLPLVTRMGETFASRVAASLLHAAGMSELVTETASEFEHLAVCLAHDPQRLRDIRERLEQSRLSCALFDCERFTRNLEAAYSAIHERYWAGLPAEHVRVSALSF